LSEVEKPPRVSIGLPVYNGEKYLEESIESILAQTYTDFELIISDNASTDRTPEICAKYCKRDPRIRYSRNQTNIGGANNTNLTFQLARGEYFRWAAHDDVCAPQLLERCVAELDRDPNVFLVYADIIEINERSERGQTKVKRDGGGQTPFARFRFLSSRRTHGCEAIYGLMRSAVLRRTGLIGNYTDSDRVLLAELGLLSPFKEIPEFLFFKRFHSGNYYRDWRGRMAWFSPDLAKTGRVTFPNWIQFVEYFRTVHKVPIHKSQKLLCYLWLLGPCALVYGRAMLKDLAVAGSMLTHSLEERQERYRNSENWS
jgi:glycosyltransferase involved in cell wall biosynthesis